MFPFPADRSHGRTWGPGTPHANDSLARPILAHPIISPAEPRIHATATRSMLEKRHPPALKSSLALLSSAEPSWPVAMSQIAISVFIHTTRLHRQYHLLDGPHIHPSKDVCGWLMMAFLARHAPVLVQPQHGNYQHSTQLGTVVLFQTPGHPRLSSQSTLLSGLPRCRRTKNPQRCSWGSSWLALVSHMPCLRSGRCFSNPP